MLGEPQVQTESDVDVAAVMAELKWSGGEATTEAFRTVQRHRELFIPHLIAAIRAASAKARDGQFPVELPHEFALLLLSEFRAKEALPAIIEAVTLPGELPLDLFDDFIHEDLPLALALLADDQPELIDGLIRDRDVNEYVRWAAVDSICILARGGAFTLEQAAERLCTHLRHAVETNDFELGNPLITTLCHLGVASTRDLVMEAFALLNVDLDFITPEQAEADFAAADAGHRPYFDRYVLPEPKDTVQYLRDLMTPRKIDVDPKHLSKETEDWNDIYEDVPEPIHAPTKVGRNEACPCGSGKKYKKCCGRNASDAGIRLTP